MAMDTPVNHFFTAVVPLLRLSRFPAGDFRATFVVCAICFGVLGLRDTLDRALSARQVAIRAAIFVAVLVSGVLRPEWSYLQRPQLLQLGLVAAALLAVLGMTRVPRIPRGALLALLLLLVVADGVRMHGYLRHPWQYPVAPTDFEELRRHLVEAMRGTPGSRPARQWVDTPGPGNAQPSMNGYLRGDFMLNDEGSGNNMRATGALLRDPVRGAYAAGPSSPMLVPSEADLAAFDTAVPASLGSATVQHFAPEQIVYEVVAPTPAILVENEPAFPGWEGSVACEGPSAQAAQPVAQAWPLRAWRVPPGHYRFCTGFRMPFLRTGATISLGVVVAWLVAVAARLRQRRARA
jgi:hypothetical protein